MNRSKRAALCGCASLVAVAATIGAASAQSTDANTEERTAGIDVITVTAQKREESLQDVPIAVTALSGEDIDAAKIEDVIDLQFNAPNLIFSGNRNLTIRGIGSQTFGGSGDAGVGVLFNGVFIQGALTTGEFFDLERVEVLRGPQGTLFGRNTTGGAINYISARPTDELDGYVSAQFESFFGVRVNTALNLPLTDKLKQRFAANYLSRKGYTFNEFDDSRIDGRDQFSVRSATLFEPTANTRADLIVEFTSEDSSRGGALKTLCAPDPTFGCSPDTVATEFPTTNFPIDLSLLPGIVRPDKFADNPDDLRTVNIDIEPVRDVEEFISSLEISHDFGPVTLTSVSGYRRGTLRSVRDFDQGFAPNAFNPGTFATPFGPVTLPDDGFGNGILTYLTAVDPITIETITTTDYNTTQTANTRARQVSTELRLDTNLDGPFNAVLGGYYLAANFRGNVTTYLPAARTLGFLAAGDTPEATTEAFAVFGEAYLDVTDWLQLTGGLRYTIDEKTIETRSGFIAFGPSFFGEETFDELTWRAAANFNPDLSFTDDTNIYASVSRGFRSGGFNPGNAAVPTFESELVTSYEIGFKNLMFDRRLQTNFAAFIYDYENLTVGNIVGTLATNVNIPSSEVMGLELEVIAEPIDGLRFEGALGLLDTEIESDFLSSDPTRGGAFFQLMGNELPNSPARTLKVAAEYEFTPLDGWLATPRVDFYSQTSFFSREFNTGADIVDDWAQLDLQMEVRPVDRDVAVTLFVKNVLNEDSITFLEANSNLVGSFRSAFLLDPRIFGANVRFGF
ncbi:MAG: TonB-dependent receptor [Pseudomonadota bacterium]